MRRMGMAVAVLVAGGVWLVPARAQACERHEKAKAQASGQKQAGGPRQAGARRASEVRSALEELDAAMAARCQCGSAADCTCKKGTCECPRCKKPRREVVDALGDAVHAPALQEARYDASAGVFI